MEQLAHLLLRFLVLVFAVGAVGCAITIPIAAYRFFSVLFEPDEPEAHQEYEPSPTASAD
jgi:hypothetical protein